MEELDGYILHNDGDLHLLNDQGNEMSTTVVARVQPFPTTIGTRVLKSHYKPHDKGNNVLVSAIPGVDDLAAGCWLNSTNDLYTVEATKVMEKCLLWNNQNALESWKLAT